MSFIRISFFVLILRMFLCSFNPEAVAGMCSVKKVLLKISQNSLENICEFCLWILRNF